MTYPIEKVQEELNAIRSGEAEGGGRMKYVRHAAVYTACLIWVAFCFTLEKTGGV